MSLATERKLAESWNASRPVGTVVDYWTGAREQPGRRSQTRSTAIIVCDTAVVWVRGLAGCVALSHVQVVSCSWLFPIGDHEYDRCGEPAVTLDPETDEWVCMKHTTAAVDAVFLVERNRFLREWEREMREKPDPDICPKCSRVRWECRCNEAWDADELRKAEREG